MPTQNPRISVTLTPEVSAILRRVSELADKSQSAFVAELLEQSVPVFQRMVRILEAAKAAKASGASDLVGNLDEAQARIEQQLGLALDSMDEGFRPLLEAAEEVKRRRAGAGGAPRSGAPAAPAAVSRRRGPPASNRGVTTSTTSSNQSKPRRAR